jgi:tRNA pseudouridine55 synthase
LTWDFDTGEVLLFNKPLRWTSFDLVKKVRNVIRVKKVGHAGTLDPLASGLMILCTGKLTRQIDSYQAQDKEYTGTITIGATTPCYDLEQEFDHLYPTDHIRPEHLLEAARKFTGKILQLPPPHSAIKIEGKRAYELARKGQEVVIKPREVEIKSFEIISVGLPILTFRIVCTKGTYIRSLAHDFGRELDSGAHLSSLCRTRIGDFKLEDAMELEYFIEKVQQAGI